MKTLVAFLLVAVVVMYGTCSSVKGQVEEIKRVRCDRMHTLIQTIDSI
jgi:hypothetical protein